MKQIEYKAIIDPTDPLLPKVEKTYTDSFPETERRDFPDVIKLIEEDPHFNMYALLNEGIYIGFITIWQFETFAYIEHFAIDESARNGGFGGIVMKQFIEKSALPIILEVELPEDEMSKRRIGFYERLGFRLNTHDYKQPPYKPGNAWIPMLLMSHGEIDVTRRFEHIKQNLYTYVYKTLSHNGETFFSS